MDKELFNKLRNEHPLTAEEALRLDEMLEGGGSRLVAQAVSALQDEEPSLTWRSALNERLASVSRSRRTALVWRFGAAATAVAAASFAVLTLVQPRVPEQSQGPRIAENRGPTLEDTILSEHQDAMGQASLGIHVSFDETGS